jgi:hypothetical protein
MKYEEIVRKICGDNWKVVSTEEREGGLGVAVIQAYLRGIRPTLNDMAIYLGVTADELYPPYMRLVNAGVFTKNWSAKTDPYLNSREPAEFNFGWAHIAAIAGGFIGNFLYQR